MDESSPPAGGFFKSYFLPLPQTLERRVELAPCCVALLVCGHVSGVGLNALRNFNCLAAGLVQVGPVARAYAGHQSAAKGAAFFRSEDFDIMAVDAGLDASPQTAARAPAAKANAADGNA
jgi:hypothetical protein